MARILARHYRLATYDLSATGSPWQEFVIFTVESDRLRIKPQGTIVLWMIFTGNDLDEPCHPVFEKKELVRSALATHLLAAIRNFRAHSFVRGLIDRISSEGSRDVIAAAFLDGSNVLFYADYVRAAERTYSQVLQHPNYYCLEGTIAAMKKLAEAKNLTVAIVLVPTKEEVYSWVLKRARPWSSSRSPSGFSVALRQISEREGMRFLDLKPLLVDRSKTVFEENGELLWWRDDTHWNSRGNKAVADIVYSSLLKQSRVPRSNKCAFLTLCRARLGQCGTNSSGPVGSER